MTRVIYYTATTLDGFLADEHDSLDWLFAVEQQRDGFPAFLEGVGAIVQGSTTYEWVLRHEDLVDHPEKWPGFYGARPTWVFTSRVLPEVAGADVRFAEGAVVDHWHRIRESAGPGDVWVVGGGDLAGQFADAGLLDEIRLSVAPVTLGSGRPLLPRRFDSDRLHLASVGQNGQFAELTYLVPRA
ncbi:dihydrofolate reductase family protein [Microbacterium fluvii]|uniref:Dihydrofolate reductase family protein n=1 Tax=Microbacterium fluvii TaxID=415215 RepID=A0ABW2HFF1_9MICO|nr:dihydrofolate reductase family protein [Microbacterium fluvii]MCU4672074.1 dihydrofolate reductase family protein [Microbacterium fluvii]